MATAAGFAITNEPLLRREREKPAKYSGAPTDTPSTTARSSSGAAEGSTSPGVTSDTPFHLNTDSNLFDDTTFHAVGGMPFGSAVDDAGRVLGQQGLYVVDGSRIAGSCAATNPSMTIAALAEHSMDRVLREDYDRFA